MSSGSFRHHMNGCQNYGSFLGPIIIRHLIFRGPKKGTIVLITTHILSTPGWLYTEKPQIHPPEHSTQASQKRCFDTEKPLRLQFL